MTTLWYPIPLSVFWTRWGRQSYKMQKGRLSVLPAAWQGTAQEQDAQLKCWLSMFWRTQPHFQQDSHNWSCTILLYLSRRGGGTYFSRAPVVRTVNKLTLLMCEDLSSSAHSVAPIQTLVTIQDPGIKTQNRKGEHLIVLSLLTGILFLVFPYLKTLTHKNHNL